MLLGNLRRSGCGWGTGQGVTPRSAPIAPTQPRFLAEWALNHRLARKRKVVDSDTKEEPFVLRESGSATHHASNTHCEKDRFRPKVRLELGSNEAIKQAVAGNLGLGMISRHAIALAPGDGVLTILPMDNFPIQSRW